MKTIYLDFDNTVVESHKKVIEIINQRYGLDKNESQLSDYGYCSIYPISEEEKLQIYESDEFFTNLEFKPDVKNIIYQYIVKYKIIILTRGTKINLEKKTKWIKNNLPSCVDVIGIDNSMDKKTIDMKDSIQIDDMANCLDTNAQLKILYKSENNFPWQVIDINNEILSVDTWQQIDEILKFYSKYDYKTLKLTY